MGHNVLINGTNYSIKGGNSLINGASYKVSGGGVLINGTRKNIAFGTPLNNLSVGSSVYMNVNGVRTEFLIVHKGNPDTNIYDSSCNGIWLLIKNIYEQRAFYISQGYQQDNDYGNKNSFKEDSQIVQYLNNDIYNRFDSNIKAIIKQIKIPARKYGSDSDDISSLYKLESGVSLKIFLLGEYELGSTNNRFDDGKVLQYFNDSDYNIRAERAMAKLNGSDSLWWLRTPNFGSSDSNGNIGCIYYNGFITTSGYKPMLKETEIYDGTGRTLPFGIRFALILPNNIKCDSNMNIIT
nr:MAG TPA: hypothetical protein [Caudoviricetes sp.]